MKVIIKLLTSSPPLSVKMCTCAAIHTHTVILSEMLHWYRYGDILSAPNTWNSDIAEAQNTYPSVRFRYACNVPVTDTLKLEEA